MMTQLIQLKSSYFTAGIVVTDNIVVEAAPIVKWMIGKTWDTCRDWITGKSGSWTIV